MPAMGATTKGGERAMLPIFIRPQASGHRPKGRISVQASGSRPQGWISLQASGNRQQAGSKTGRGASSVRLDVCGVDFDTDRLANKIDRKHKPRVRALADQTADHAL